MFKFLAAIDASPHTITGNIAMGGQYHFYLETQTSICTPTDVGGMYVKSATQWIDGVLGAVAQILGLDESKYVLL
jgi:xanthine dehydrogenase large subunit